jgi:hypothetical protein
MVLLKYQIFFLRLLILLVLHVNCSYYFYVKHKEKGDKIIENVRTKVGSSNVSLEVNFLVHL